MTQAVADILKEVEQLSVSEKAELADCLAGRLGSEISPSIEQVHFETVKRRIGEVESGRVKVIPGSVASSRIRLSISKASQ